MPRSRRPGRRLCPECRGKLAANAQAHRVPRSGRRCRGGASLCGFFVEQVFTLTFKQVEEIIGQWLVKVFADPDFALQRSEPPLRLGLGWRHQACDGSAMPGNNDLFAGVDLIDQTGQVGLGSIDVDMHGAAPAYQTRLDQTQLENKCPQSWKSPT